MILFGLWMAVAAQAPRVVVTQADESSFPAIRVYFEVQRPDGTFLRDAPRSSFRVTEDGRDRPIEDFESPVSVVARPTTVVLVVDRSGSMRQDRKMEALRGAVATFLSGIPAGSRVAVVAFGSDVRLACPFTTDVGQVKAAVDALEPFGATRYRDAVRAGLELLEAEPGRRALLALTDGLDTDSSTPIDLVIAEARRASVPVHTLGLGRGDRIDAPALDELAEQTRGQSYRATDAESLRSIYQELAERLGSSYRLTYTTDRPVLDGTLRPIRVYHAESSEAEAGEAAVFIPGMVVRQAGWSRVFLGLVVGLGGLGLLPSILDRRKNVGEKLKPGPPDGR